MLPDCPLAPPYNAAKDHLLLTELLDTPDQLAEILRRTARDLPLPKPQKPKAK